MSPTWKLAPGPKPRVRLEVANTSETEQEIWWSDAGGGLQLVQTLKPGASVVLHPLSGARFAATPPDLQDAVFAQFAWQQKHAKPLRGLFGAAAPPAPSVHCFDAVPSDGASAGGGVRVACTPVRLGRGEEALVKFDAAESGAGGGAAYEWRRALVLGSLARDGGQYLIAANIAGTPSADQQLDALRENMRRGGIKPAASRAVVTETQKRINEHYPELAVAPVAARAIKQKEWGPVCNWD